MKSQILIGAANSGAGKTTFTAGLLRALKNRGLHVQPYKCGPDYIDTRYHAVASGSESVNLDTWLSSENHVRSIYGYYGSEADCCVTEGVMGLFDGYSRKEGSSASVAALLGIPVVLVVNAVSAAYSVAPLVYGFSRFDSQVKIAGVVFNRVSSPSHFSFLKQACDDTGVACFGYMPKDDSLAVPSRHLGLVLDGENPMEQLASHAAELVESHIDIDRMLEACRCPFPEKVPDPFGNFSHCIEGAQSLFSVSSRPKIAVARDEAFSFTYRANIDALAKIGDMEFFSPIHDGRLPDADLVYLPGGYPELYAEELAGSVLKDRILTFARSGGHVLAECGGMIYLGRTLECDGKVWEMAGVLPLDTTMEGARLVLGYRSAECGGSILKGHEFHYSKTVAPDVMPSVAVQYNARGQEVPVPLYRKGNVVAGYTHWYWADGDFTCFWK